MFQTRITALIVAVLALAAAWPAAARGLGDPYACTVRDIAAGERFAFRLARKDYRILTINGDITVRLYHGKRDISRRIEASHDGDTGTRAQFVELDGSSHSGAYVLQVVRGGRGAVCVSEPG